MKKLAYLLVIGSALLVAGCGGKAEVAPATQTPSATETTSAAGTTEAAETTASDADTGMPRETDINLDEGLDPAQVAAMTDAERESNFLAVLDQQAIYVGHDDTQLEVARQTCAQLDTMAVGDDIVPYGLQLVDKNGLTEYDAGKFIGLSTVFFCPENMEILGY
ncbi:DUF732 domain-containing protein [Tomitella biformata]|uniref:DUF732 domain-containing protein n=1 Tax=Tomitella biformata TaxID=630403 RepID=UPI000464C340|nr:DUF732 domain-containing protein [Tomitella biformata]